MKRPLIFCVLEDGGPYLPLHGLLAEKYGEDYEVLLLLDEKEACDLAALFAKQERPAPLTLCEEFLLTTRVDDTIIEIARHFPQTKVLYITETELLEAAKLTALPTCRFLPKNIEEADFMAVVEAALLEYEEEARRHDQALIYQTLPAAVEDLSIAELTQDLMQSVLRYTVERCQAQSAFFILAQDGKLSIAAARASEDKLDRDLRYRVQRETEALEAEIIERLNATLLLQPLPGRRLAVTAHRDGEVRAYVYAELPENGDAFFQTHHVKALELVLAVGDIALERLQVQETEPAVADEPAVAIRHEFAPETAQTQSDAVAFSQAIQESLLQGGYALREYAPESFIFYEPLKGVSSSFYWFTEKYYKLLLAVADCQEPGVPAAFLSLVGANFLSSIVQSHAILDPDIVLGQLNQQFATSFKMDPVRMRGRLLFNLSLCSLDLTSHELKFAGAHKSMVLVTKEGARELRGDAIPVGVNLMQGHKTQFNCQSVRVQPGDMLYLFSRGMVDQMRLNSAGGAGVEPLKRLGEELFPLSIEDQLTTVRKMAGAWRTAEALSHDMLLLAVRVPELPEA